MASGAGKRHSGGIREGALRDGVEKGFPTTFTAKKMEINHVAACITWPLRMYLWLQQQLNSGVESRDG